MSKNESPATTHPANPPATLVPIAASPGTAALAPITSHSAHALVTFIAPTATSDASRDGSIRLLQSDAATEDAHNDLDSRSTDDIQSDATAEDTCNDLDLGSTEDEDCAFEQLDPKKGEFQDTDLDLKEEDRAPTALPVCCSSSAPHEVAKVVAGALGSAVFPKVARSKVRIKVSSFKPVEAVRDEMHLGLGFSTEAKEGIRDILTLPESQVCIQGMRDITTMTKDYKKFCSKPEGDLVLEVSSKGADMFNGGKRQKKRALDSDGAGSSGTSTKSKPISTGGRVGGGRGRERGRSRMPSTAYCPMLHQMDKLPPGFI